MIATRVFEPPAPETENTTVSCSSACVLPPMVAVSVAPTAGAAGAVSVEGALLIVSAGPVVDEAARVSSPAKDAVIG